MLADKMEPISNLDFSCLYYSFTRDSKNIASSRHEEENIWRQLVSSIRDHDGFYLSKFYLPSFFNNVALSYAAEQSQCAKFFKY